MIKPGLTELQQIDGGVRVHSTEKFHVDVLAKAYGNFRIVTTPVGREYEYTRGWCYQREAVEVILIALAFEPLDDNSNEPYGWIKETGTERRACASLYRSQRKEHRGYDPECPDCGDERLI